MKSKNAFTLAETLITLVIVGVVAALTVPNLIVKYQKEQTVVRLKKGYSTLAQALNKSVSENGPVNTWDYWSGHHSGEYSAKLMNKYLVPYLNVVKKAEVHPTNTDYSITYLADGTSIMALIKANSTLNIIIDINGDKTGKQRREKFYFILFYADGTLKPWSYDIKRSLLTNGSVTESCAGSGRGCAALIMKDGWKISDDYPW